MKYPQFNIIDVTQFQQLIRKSGLRHQKFMEELGITSYTTWRARRDDPTVFTIKDLMVVARLLRCEPETLFRVILDEAGHHN